MKTAPLSVQDVYEQAKRLSGEDREDLIVLLLEDVAPKPPNSVRSREHLIELLREGMASPTHPVTEETWKQRLQRAAEREKAAK